ncbi:MAG: hypothetical protein OEM52_00175 [bacterium]|nr:hypothetical protein [bacterium]
MKTESQLSLNLLEAMTLLTRRTSGILSPLAYGWKASYSGVTGDFIAEVHAEFRNSLFTVGIELLSGTNTIVSRVKLGNIHELYVAFEGRDVFAFVSVDEDRYTLLAVNHDGPLQLVTDIDRRGKESESDGEKSAGSEQRRTFFCIRETAGGQDASETA